MKNEKIYKLELCVWVVKLAYNGKILEQLNLKNEL